MRTRGYVRLAGAAVLLGCSGWRSRCEAQAQTYALAADQARVAIGSGRFLDAARLYTWMLSVSRTAKDSAGALFGRAFSVQQTTATPEEALADSSAAINADTVSAMLDSYRLAQRLDSARYFVATQYNVGQILSAAGRHGSAATELARGAVANDSLRGALLLADAREYELSGDMENAVSMLRLAARERAAATEAQGRLVAIFARTGNVRELLSLADTLRSDAAPMQSMNEALLELMRQPQWAQWRERCLLLLARNYAAMDLGPLYFGETQRAELDRVRDAARGTELSQGITALEEAYQPRDSSIRFTMASAASWWQGTLDRRRIWSSTMRSLGDWYNRAGNQLTAMSFYEASIGPEFDFNAPWIDLAALPPLATIYTMLSATEQDAKVRRIAQFEQGLFEAKGKALAANDVRRIRMLRLTLGSLFARQGKWTGGFYGATVQLEAMRRHTRDLRREGVDLHDPPDVLELLMNEYQRRGCTAKAVEVGREVRDEYKRQEEPAKAERVGSAVAAMEKAGLKPCSFSGF
jgi:hypothetical protein